MQGLIEKDTVCLHDSTGALVGLKGSNGKEYLSGAFLNSSSGQQAPNAYFSGAVAITGGTINAATIGQTTPGAVKTSNFAATYTDSSGTPGNVTNASPRGRAAFAAAGTSVVVTSTLVTATSTILISLGGTDTTLTTARVTAAAGSFTVTGNAAATATTPFDFLVVN